MNEEVRTGIIKEIKAAGFAYVTLDLSGFVSGSMNVGVSDNK
jgi:PP-loop superfamily ATP-utilizing enzyme